jgi:hypothetical protein
VPLFKPWTETRADEPGRESTLGADPEELDRACERFTAASHYFLYDRRGDEHVIREIAGDMLEDAVRMKKRWDMLNAPRRRRKKAA